MKNPAFYPSDHSTYPGEYVPLLREEEVKEELKHSHAGEIHPPVNITELADSFEVEVAIPGVTREEFFIYADKNVLSVFVLRQEAQIQKSKNFHLHEFDYQCFTRSIVLPENVDIEFACAEYKAGILHMYVPKMKQPAKNVHANIVVY
jgi:HSP20 family protein